MNVGSGHIQENENGKCWKKDKMMSLWQPTVSESSYFATLLEYEHNSNTME